RADALEKLSLIVCAQPVTIEHDFQAVDLFRALTAGRYHRTGLARAHGAEPGNRRRAGAQVNDVDTAEIQAFNQAVEQLWPGLAPVVGDAQALNVALGG